MSGELLIIAAISAFNIGIYAAGGSWWALASGVFCGLVYLGMEINHR